MTSSDSTRRRWFAPWGWTHRPAAWPGVVVTALAVAFCVQVFVAVDRRSHSVSDTLYGIFPYVVPCLLLLAWVASHTSGRRRPNESTARDRATRDRATRVSRDVRRPRSRPS